MTAYMMLKTDSVGELLLAADDSKLTGVYFADCGDPPVPEADWRLDPKHPVLRQARGQLQEYLVGRRTSFSLPLLFNGTKFQKAIWTEISKIPFGKTISYSELAQRAGTPAAVRAAGSATGKNPFAIVVPCHRVVSKDGSLGGYGGTLPRKRRLLDLERRQ